MTKKTVNQAASELGKLSVKKRHKGKTKKEISEYYSKMSKSQKKYDKISRH